MLFLALTSRNKHTFPVSNAVSVGKEASFTPMHSVGINEGKSRVGGATDESSFTLIMTAETICYSDRLYV